MKVADRLTGLLTLLQSQIECCGVVCAQHRRNEPSRYLPQIEPFVVHEVKQVLYMTMRNYEAMSWNNGCSIVDRVEVPCAKDYGECSTAPAERTSPGRLWIIFGTYVLHHHLGS